MFIYFEPPKKVVDSSYNLQVFDQLVLAGNGATLKCQAPSHMLGQLELVSWLKDEKILVSTSLQSQHESIQAYPTMTTGMSTPTTGPLASNNSRDLSRRLANSRYRSISSDYSENNLNKQHSKYFILQFGHLHIRNVSKLDAGNYKCRMRNRLTGRVMTSQIGARLMVDERPQETPPMVSSNNPKLSLDQTRKPLEFIYALENSELLYCIQLQSFPVSKFVWFKESTDPAQTPIKVPTATQLSQLAITDYNTGQQSGNDPTVRAIDECLVIPKVQIKHAGNYFCQVSAASNQSSESLGTKEQFLVQKLSMRLFVMPTRLSAQLRLQSSPQPVTVTNGQSESTTITNRPQQIVRLGSSVQLNCTVHGAPFDSVAWFKDGKLLAVLPATATSGPSQPQLHQPSSQNSDTEPRLVQPNVISIDNFELKHAGIYQCQVFSSQVSPNLTISNQVSSIFGINSNYDAHSDLRYLIERDYFRSASGSIQLDLQLSKPNMIQKFPNQLNLNQADSVSIQCGATGLPAPKIIWFLDNQPILPSSSQPPISLTNGKLRRFDFIEKASENSLFGSTLDQNLFVPVGNWEDIYLTTTSESINLEGVDNYLADSRFEISTQTVVSAHNHHQPLTLSQLNVSRLEPSESGHYKCLALNPLGSNLHEGQLNVWSEQLQLRPYQAKNRTLIAGKRAILQCPLVGYPLKRLEWFFGGQRVPFNHRQRIEPVKEGIGGQLELINVDKITDSGLYTCKGSLQRNDSVEDGSGDSDSSMEGQVLVRVRVAPVIDAQSLPDLIQATEGMRTKLVCSVVEGDHPVDIRWVKRLNDLRKQSSNNYALANGYELMENTQSKSQGGSSTSNEDSITIHNLEDSSLLTFKSISHVDSGDYLCIAENEVSRTIKRTRIVVNVVPSWSIEPPNEVNILLNSKLQLDCSAHGFPNPQTNWKREIVGRNSTSIGFESQTKDPFQVSGKLIDIISNYRQRILANGTLIIDQIDQTDSGIFMCQSSNGIGSGLSKLIQVNVNIPPYFKQKSVTQLAQLNGRVEVRCVAFGDQPIIMGWRYGEYVIDLVNDSRRRLITERSLGIQSSESVISIDNLHRNDSGQFTCIASNEFGTEEMHFRLVVQEAPEPPILMRPVRADSRKATISFRPPFVGNSAIRRYTIGYKQVDVSPEANLNTDLSGDHSHLGWLQTTIEASESTSVSANIQPATVLQNFPTLSNLTESDQTSNEFSTSSQVVHLNLCCLQPYTRYLVRVKAINDIGSSDWSKAIVFQTDEEAIGGPPLDVSVEPTGAHSLKVKWRPPARHLQNGMIRGYYIGYRAQNGLVQGPGMATIQIPQESPTVKLLEANEAEQYQYKNIQLDLQVNPNMQNLVINPDKSILSSDNSNISKSSDQLYLSYLTNLRRRTAYSVIVQAYNKVGAGPRSDQIIISTLDAAPPMSPHLRVSSVTYNSAQLVWSTRKFTSSNRGQSNNSVDLMPSLQRDNEPMEEDDDPQSFNTVHFRFEDPSELNAPISSREDWQQRRINRMQSSQPFTLSDLRCGSRYSAFMSATNSLGQSEPGNTVKFNTLGYPPIAPKNSQDFLILNSSYLIMRLSSWRNGGCYINSFVLRYKSSFQPKWTIIEHQLYPTVQTVTVAGVAVFSIRNPEVEDVSSSSVQVSMINQNQGRVKETPPQADAMISIVTPNQQQQNRMQTMNDFIIRNLQVEAPYRLVVEAISEAGTTVAEYEFELANSTSSTIGVQVNGQMATGQDLDPNDSVYGQAAQAPDYSNSDYFSRRPGGGGYRGTQTVGNNNPFAAAWSLTGLLVFGSIVTGSITIALSLCSVIRLGALSFGGSHNKRTDRLSCRDGEDSSSSMSLLSAMLCCSSSSRSGSSNASSSHSSIGAMTCYQISNDCGGQPMDAYCSIGGQQQNPKLDNGLNGPMFGQANSIVSSTSLSALGASGRFDDGQRDRHHRTLAHCHLRRSTLEEQDMDCSPQSDTRHMKPHHSSTLGKQSSLMGYSTFSPKEHRPMTYNHEISITSPLYGKLNSVESRLNQGNGTPFDNEKMFEMSNHYQLHHGNGPTTSGIYPLSSSSQATSGYGTAGGRNSVQLGPEAHFDQNYNSLSVANQIANISALLTATDQVSGGYDVDLGSDHQTIYQQTYQPGNKIYSSNGTNTINQCNPNDGYTLQSIMAMNQLRSKHQIDHGMTYEPEPQNSESARDD